MDGRVEMRLRVGITGHRDLTADHPGLETEIAKAIEYITQVLANRPVPVVAVSSLAEGADRIVAAQILAEPGSELEVILPLEPDDYAADFTAPASVEEFDALLASAARTETIAAAGSRQDAYLQAGRTVVDRSDVVIVVWDGEPARGPGGTAQIYEYAQRSRTPVLLILVDDDSAMLAADILPFAVKNSLPLADEAMRRLEAYNGERVRGSAPLLEADSDSLKAAAPLIGHFSHYFTRADAVARTFQRRWLWASRAMYILAPLAVAVVAAQVEFAPEQVGYYWYEFAILIFLTLLLTATRRLRWHMRWVTARYLAEKIRAMLFLSITGLTTLDRPASRAHPDVISELAWAERAATEIWLTRPGCEAPRDVAPLIKVLYEEWVRKQQHYHASVGATHRKRSDLVHLAAVGLFGISAIAALLHGLGTGSTRAHEFPWWGFLAITIPSIAAAIGGYGAQRDYTRHAERSRLFTYILDEGTAQLMSVRTTAELQLAALAISRTVLGETTDWFSVVHSQDLELPS